MDAGTQKPSTVGRGWSADRSKRAQRHVLLVGALEGSLAKVAPMLQRAEFDVHTVEPSEFVLDLVLGTTFELLIVSYPMPEVDINELLRSLREFNSETRGASLLLLAEPGFLDAAQGLVALGANRAVSLDWSASRLWQAVGDLLHVAPRVGVRALVYADVEATHGDARSLFQTVNVSISGMLLRGTDAFLPGSHFDFVFCLPGEPRPLEGTAEVVRRADPDRESVHGLGIRFVHLRDDAKFRLERFISSRRL